MQLFERTLGQWLEHWAEETPDKEYIVYSDRNLRFTWSQLNQRVDDIPCACVNESHYWKS
jgi:fatty-acyl-CoA synthase